MSQVNNSENLDKLLNKTALDFFLYSGIGYVSALCFGAIFFRNVKIVSQFGAGVGCGYAFNKNRKLFNFESMQ